MRQVFYAGLMALLLTSSVTGTSAQTAGATKLGVTVVELADVINGWSAQRQILGQSVYNDKNEKVGNVEDLIINKDRSATYAIVSTGGFLGIGSHDVAIPAAQFTMKDNKLLLPGATKEQIRSMPPFEYSRK